MKQGELMAHENAPVIGTSSESALLVKMAIEKNLDTDKLEKLLELHERNERRLAEQEFELRFADMQKEYMPVVKNKSGAVGKYAPLPDILTTYMPILTKHGFSVRWGEEIDEKTNDRIITCYLSGYGFTRAASMALPVADKNGMINNIQARAITNSYGRRYTFMNVTGCIIAEEDTDGNIPGSAIDPAVAIKEMLDKMGAKMDERKRIAEIFKKKSPAAALVEVEKNYNKYLEEQAEKEFGQ